MKRILRLILIGALTLIVISSACNLPAQPPGIQVATLPAAGHITSTSSPVSTLSGGSPVPAIPITGMDAVSLQCQFCVNDEAHAVLIMSNQVFFSVSDPNTGVTCLSAQEIHGRRILLCRGVQQVSFNLNVCVDNANCLQFPITLQPCPLAGTGTPTTLTPFAPILLTPILASSTPEPRDTPLPTATMGTPAPEPTATTGTPSQVSGTPATPPSSIIESTATDSSIGIRKPITFSRIDSFSSIATRTIMLASGMGKKRRLSSKAQTLW
jgi:hypothetical protein